MAPTNLDEEQEQQPPEMSQPSIQRVQTSEGGRVVSPIGMTPAPDIDIIFIKELPEKFQCPVCSQALRSPMKLSCGDLVCAACLLNLTSTECPKCGAPLDKKTGHAYNCQYMDVPCPRGCGEMLCKNNLDEHLKFGCSKRALPCRYCGQEVAIKGMESHIKICQSVPVDCPNSCGVEGVTRAQLKLHMPSCPKAGSSCPFAEIGCEYAGGRETLQQHIKSEPIKHLTLLCDAVLDLKNVLASLQLNIETMTNTMDLLHRRSETLEKLYGAQLIWRIDNVRQKQNEARSGSRTIIFSEPFMSGRHGYKMMASIALYGDGPMRGQYVSAFVCIMRGEYDPLLEWPFTSRVTISVMDQHPDLEERNDVSYVFKPNPIPAYKAYLDRPISARNASFGAMKFCEIEIFERYIFDDILFIKVNVETKTGDI